MLLLSAVMITGLVAAVLGATVWRLTSTPRWIPAVIGSVGGVLLALPPVFASLQPAGPHPAAPEAYATVAPAAPRVPVAPPASPASPGGAHASTPVL
ncbi:hypothetical protein SLAV_19465 [Streptomyces lavendulae subsp. lavendulae]|uniref:Uncharacterized protein n=1 Tax=Streptomyces lavendulae subsp. lavendulae TaxID=58340 RepID=A0A2K8PG60_STRLA|nr:hypothetical protein [Streptomyces lavendulae]ATZ25717.1 hypothetical protein SLAV_19465 [Streptomyces lavendulae subsp. lavendulae]QUQ55545.1 hypothetical protein SLLC_17565 [Streptomyces lavendulae subsp. lavendulae]